jgi:GPH family glycoside/pentoside/hexuronide:cation symporter
MRTADAEPVLFPWDPWRRVGGRSLFGAPRVSCRLVPDSRLSRPLYVSYALGSVGTGGFGTVPGLLLLYYLTNVLGVSPDLAGFVVFAPKAWDVLINPYVGRLSDRALARHGTRAPFLLAGALSLPVFFALMFWPSPEWSPEGAAAFVAVLFLLAATGFAVFQVPYIALPAEITDSYEERTTIMSYRIAFLTAAILLFGAGAPALVQAFGGGPASYRWMGVVAAGVIGLGLGGAYLCARRARPVLTAGAAEGSLIDQLRVARKNRRFVVLLGAYMAQALAAGCMLAAAPYVATYLLDDPGATTPLFTTLVAPAVLMTPIWARLSRSTGKKRGFLLAAVVFGAAAFALVTGRWIEPAGVYLLVGVCGIGYAGLQLFPLSMLPDTIELHEAETGEKRAGVFTGLWTAGETASLALGPALFSLLLAATGFVPARAGEAALQSDLAVTGIALGFSLLPTLLIALSVPLIRCYSVTAEDLAAARATADSKHRPGP